MRNEDFLLLGPRELSHNSRITGRRGQQRQRISKQLSHGVVATLLSGKRLKSVCVGGVYVG